MAPEVFDDLDGPPDAIFVGGGLVAPDLLEDAFDALRPGGRLVANAVTLEGEARLVGWGEELGGTFARLAVARSDKVGRRTALRPMMDVLQLRVSKP